MSTRPFSPCNMPGCPHIAVEHGRCLIHARAQKQAYERERPDSRARGYDAEWAKVRRKYLAQQPMCEWRDCPNQATDVHHIVALNLGGTHDVSNLVALCHGHHSRITGSTQAWGRGKR
jgi:5-methylcytosine-specific restriction enzyme A